MPNKPTKYGYVFIKVVDKLGWVFDFTVCDSVAKNDTPFGSIHDTVMRLLAAVPSDQHHHVFFDNYYTSTLFCLVTALQVLLSTWFQFCFIAVPASPRTGVPLFLALLHRGIHATGTLRANRAGLPPEVMSAKWTTLGKAKCYSRLPGVFCTAWRDVNAMVMFLSTACTPWGAGILKRHTKSSGAQPVEVPAPPVARAYRQEMGHVDRSDQAQAYYRTMCG
jgi:hypothetical protein